MDAQLLISAQATAHECAWLYGAVALDFARIGAHYVEGGAWSLARTLAAAFARDGGELRYRTWVKRILTRNGRAIGVETERGEQLFAGQVVANVTLWDAARLLGQAAPRRLLRAIAGAPRGWGACTLYLGVDEAAIPTGMAEHHQVIACYDRPLGEANSVFISAHPADDRSRAPAGQRAITVSTHTDAERWWRWRNEDPARYRAEKAAMAERMLDTVALALPEHSAAHSLPADRHAVLVLALHPPRAGYGRRAAAAAVAARACSAWGRARPASAACGWSATAPFPAKARRR